MFELATVGLLAERIDQLSSGQLTQSRPRLIATAHDEPMPLSASQLRSWFAYRLDGPSPVNNIPFAAKLTGPWDVDALIAAVGDVLARHEILRTSYVELDGVPYQVVGPVGVEVPVRRAEGVGEAWLQEQLDIERRHCFELDSELPIWVAVLRTENADEHVLSVVVHHIASDHWSAGVLFSDVMTAYRARRGGEAPSWAPLRVQYADYAAWQRTFLGDASGQESAIAAEQREYWTRKLAGLPEDTGLRPDFPRQPVPSGEGESVDFQIDSATRAKLGELCRELGITEFMLLQTAVAVVLHKAGGGVDIPLGTPVAGRTEAELDQLIGFFVNILVLRNDMDGNPTLRELLKRARETALAAYAHQDLPFDRVVDSVSPVRFAVAQPAVPGRRARPGSPVRHAGHRNRPRGRRWTRHRVHVAGPHLRHGPRRPQRQLLRHRRHRRRRLQLQCHLPYRALRQNDHRAVGAMAVAGGRRVRRGSRLEPARRCADRCGRTAPHPAGLEPRRSAPHDRPRTIPELLEPSRAWDADRIAVRCGDERIDYPALHRRSDNLAALLAKNGAGPGALVGLSTRRSIDLVVTLVAIMKAGAGYFPIDPGYPLARKQFMLDDVAPPVVVATTEAVATMPHVAGVELISLDDPHVRDLVDSDDVDPQSRDLPRPHPDDPMYLVFTSGSTGKPKGAVGTHRSMAARLDWQLRHYPPRTEDVRLAQASITFLEGGMEMLAGLAAGATMILADDDEHRDPEALGELMTRYSVAQVTAVPSLVSALVDSRPDAVRALSRLVCGGEPVSTSLLQRLVSVCADDGATELLNNIGSTETSGAVSRGPLGLPNPLVGKPVPGAQAYPSTTGCVRCRSAWWASCTTPVTSWRAGTGNGPP